MLEYLVALFASHGLAILCGTLFLASFGPPLPASFLLIAAGALGQHGGMRWATLVLGGTLAAVAGDLLAAELARAAGQPLRRRLGPARFRPAERALERWGAPGIFLSRWLLTPVGPTLNLVCGMAGFPRARFAALVAAGELIWVAGYSALGRLFSARIDQLNDVVGLLPWLAALGIGGAALWRVRRRTILAPKHGSGRERIGRAEAGHRRDRAHDSGVATLCQSSGDPTRVVTGGVKRSSPQGMKH